LPISVIIVAKNAESTIEECLDSVRRNNPAEIIVVDGLSTDKTVSLSRLDLPCGIRLFAPGYRHSEHLWFFTKQTLRHLLERQGFHIRAIKCVNLGVQPKVNSLVMRYLPWLFPLYELVSEVVMFPFNAIGRGLQVMAIANKA